MSIYTAHFYCMLDLASMRDQSRDVYAEWSLCYVRVYQVHVMFSVCFFKTPMAIPLSLSIYIYHPNQPPSVFFHALILQPSHPDCIIPFLHLKTHITVSFMIKLNMVVWIRSILVEITKKSSRFGWFCHPCRRILCGSSGNCSHQWYFAIIRNSSYYTLLRYIQDGKGSWRLRPNRNKLWRIANTNVYCINSNIISSLLIIRYTLFLLFHSKRTQNQYTMFRLLLLFKRQQNVSSQVTLTLSFCSSSPLDPIQ